MSVQEHMHFSERTLDQEFYTHKDSNWQEF